MCGQFTITHVRLSGESVVNVFDVCLHISTHPGRPHRAVIGLRFGFGEDGPRAGELSGDADGESASSLGLYPGELGGLVPGEVDGSRSAA